jgi:hypothetical protein
MAEPHFAPFCFGFPTRRVRFFSPTPHVALHVDQTDHSELGEQSHLSRLHDAEITRLPHLAPPCCAGVMTFRTRVFFPPPHGCEHVLHLPYSPTQSMGHDWPLHGDFSNTFDGHAVPLLAGGRIIWRLRYFWPWPQLFVHEPHVIQVPTTQFTGQSLRWHVFVCFGFSHTIFFLPPHAFERPLTVFLTEA